MRPFSLGPRERAAALVLLSGNAQLQEYLVLEGFELWVRDYRGAPKGATFLIRALLSLCGHGTVRLHRVRDLEEEDHRLLGAAVDALREGDGEDECA